MKKTKLTQIAYRCSACGEAMLGFLGLLPSVSDMLRIRCECDGSTLDIKKVKDGGLTLSIPCVYCRAQHTYNLSSDVAEREALTALSCPYSNMDIAFIGSPDDVSREIERTGEELRRVIASFGGEELSDIQPKDEDEESALPDPAVYDTLNFLVRDLEDEGKVDCPCHGGRYALRFTDDGVQVFCEDCGATYTFRAKTPSMAEQYLTLDSINLG